uniref:mannan endo-1,4-beta-mannosidase n=1 Tax=Arcella intermedia TaxID=1963864 RepID=A0A6B2L8V3_9EUKA
MYPQDQQFLFSNLRAAGIKVLRVWLDGQSSGTTKGTNIQKYPDLEPNTVGVFDDTVLGLIDQLMLNAKGYGIKLLISMHSFNRLSSGDVYGQRWGTGYFYEQQDAMDAFDNRLRHVLNHVHTSLGKPWKELKDYIFAFEAQNEAMIGKGSDYIAAHQYWQCDRAKTIRSVLGPSSGILVTTGGESWMDESLQPDWFACKELDVIAIHAYGVGDLMDSTKMQNYVSKAVDSGKMLLFQEWGACYFDTDNSNCPNGNPLDPSQRDANIARWADVISSAGIPWMYWQIIPNKDPHYGYDFEIGVNDQNWNTFQFVANKTTNYSTPFNYAPYLL